MEPLITLTAVTAVVLVVTAVRGRTDGIEIALRSGVGAMFLLTGVAHFVGMRAELIDMVPDWLPQPGLLVTVTGILELAGAAGMLIGPLVRWSGLGLSLMLLGMFPANVSLALSGTELAWYDELLPRTITQVIFLAATVSLTVLASGDHRRQSGTPIQAPTHQEA